MAGDQAFVIMQVGDKGSIDRKRADELFQYVIKPVLDEIGIKPYRSDLDPTPGQINPQMLQRLLEARVIIADLTGRNPNVFYEFGIAHSFARPIIPLVDNVQSLPFDAHDERVIVLGEYREALSVPQAEEAKEQLTRVLEVVLASNYKPSSPLVDVAASRSLDQLAPENPLASELAAIRAVVEEMRRELSSVRKSIARSLADVISSRDLARAPWVQNSRGGQREGVQVAYVNGQVAVRDGKDPQGPVLTFRPSDWQAFLNSVRGGLFNSE